MRNYRTNIKRGFTLVEILIVVIILGILAAIVIPQFSNASEDARKNSATSLIQTVRSAVELYRLEHAGRYPTGDGEIDGTWDWTLLTEKTNADGTKTGTPQYGPYLQQTPVNPFNNSSTVGATAGDSTGFVWDDTNGRMSISFKDGSSWSAK